MWSFNVYLAISRHPACIHLKDSLEFLDTTMNLLPIPCDFMDVTKNHVSSSLEDYMNDNMFLNAPTPGAMDPPVQPYHQPITMVEQSMGMFFMHNTNSRHERQLAKVKTRELSHLLHQAKTNSPRLTLKPPVTLDTDEDAQVGLPISSSLRVELIQAIEEELRLRDDKKPAKYFKTDVKFKDHADVFQKASALLDVTKRTRKYAAPPYPIHMCYEMEEAQHNLEQVLQKSKTLKRSRSF